MKLPEELPNIRSTSDQLLPIGIPSRVHARERSKSLELPIGRAAGQQPISPSSTQKVSGCSCDGDLLTRLINEFKWVIAIFYLININRFSKSVERRKAAEYELHRTALKRQVRADIPGEVSWLLAKYFQWLLQNLLSDKPVNFLLGYVCFFFGPVEKTTRIFCVYPYCVVHFKWMTYVCLSTSGTFIILSCVLVWSEWLKNVCWLSVILQWPLWTPPSSMM